MKYYRIEVKRQMPQTAYFFLCISDNEEIKDVIPEVDEDFDWDGLEFEDDWDTPDSYDVNYNAARTIEFDNIKKTYNSSVDYYSELAKEEKKEIERIKKEEDANLTLF